MKKQLFLIVLLALFAGISSVNAQPCVGNGFTPSAGTDYSYVVTIPPTGGYTGVGGVYNWYITQDVNLLNTLAIIPAVNANFSVNVGAGLSTYNSLVPGGTTNTIGLQWTPAASGQVFYLVLKYSESNPNAIAPGCAAQNIRVWQINPNNATNFLLAISGASNNGTALTIANQCAADVDGATVIPGSPTKIDYNYGENIIYYRVDATGTTGNWTPSIRLPLLAGAALSQVYAIAEWNDDVTGVAGTWTAFAGAPFPNTGGDFTSPIPAAIADPLLGASILIRVRISNVNYETLANQPITVGIDGYLPSGLSDIIGPGAVLPALPCDQEVVFGKQATYTILARPDITPVTGPFITPLP
jgi:hypothetical protein